MHPLVVDRLPRLRLARNSRFTTSTLEQHVEENGNFCWVAAGTDEYVVGGRWRRRADIGHVIEMTQGRHRDALLERLTASFRRIGMTLVVVACDDFSLYVSFYSKQGFEKLDEIIELERYPGATSEPANGVRVRPYAHEDLAEAIETDRLAFPWLWQNNEAEFRWYLSMPGVEMYVAESQEGKIVGYAGLTINGSHGHLDRLAVHPDWQKKGYGTALLRATIERMERQRTKRITLSTQAHNVRSQSLYRKFGFHHTFRSQTIYGLRLD